MAEQQTLYAASLDDIRAAAERIRGHAHITPVRMSWVQQQLQDLSAAWRDDVHPAGEQRMCLLQVLTSTTLDRLAGHKLKFKCEIFQKG